VKCFFGGAGCSFRPGLTGTAFIAMYVVSYIGGGLLLRYAEGATYLAIVQVRYLGRYLHLTIVQVRYLGGYLHLVYYFGRYLRLAIVQVKYAIMLVRYLLLR
jgi:hypothetical protein